MRSLPAEGTYKKQKRAGALSDADQAGQAYDLCGPETFTLARMVDEILAVLRRRRIMLHVPKVVATAQAAVLEWLYTNLLGQAPPLNRDQLVMLQEDNVGDGMPANKRFGLRHQPFREGIAKYLNAA